MTCESEAREADRELDQREADEIGSERRRLGTHDRFAVCVAVHDACSRVQEWRRSVAAGSGLRVAVNISGRHLQQGDLIADVQGALQESGLEAGNLVIELTESSIMHNTEGNLEIFRKLKALGVRLAIDDFGMGYSSLSYLARFPATVLKIDREFVEPLEKGLPPQDVPHDHSTALVAAIVGMAHALGLAVVAEGVETAAQLDAIRQLGCEYAQGFHLARPGPASDIEPLLRRRRSTVLR